MQTRRMVAGFAAAAAVAGLASAGAAAQSRWTARFAFVPQRVVQGKPAAVTVRVRRSGTRCSLGVRYADGTSQKGLGRVTAVGGRATWSWNLSLTTPAGAARASVVCGSVRLSRRFLVVGGTAVPSKLQVVAQGWSQRPDSFGKGSTLSYGIQLRNPDARDAKDVSVLLNAIGDGGFVLATSTAHVSEVGARSTFNLGGSMNLPGQAPPQRLEIVVQASAHVPHELQEPSVENVAIVPGSGDDGWLGSVTGDLVNDDLTRNLTGAQLSVVVFDGTGKIVGGGSGLLFANLPPGTRSFFSASSGLNAVPATEASTVAISVEASYSQPGA